MGNQRTVKGLVVLRNSAPTPHTLRVVVEDVSRADAPARIIGETIIHLAQPLSAGSELPFSITVPDVSESVRYNARVHVDCSGSGVISEGDLISTKAHPILTQGHADDVVIEAKMI